MVTAKAKRVSPKLRGESASICVDAVPPELGHAAGGLPAALSEDVPRDAFNHVQLDKINPGAWFAKQFAEKVGAEKTMVQKSGYFSRSAPANAEDLALIKQCTDHAVDSALRGESGVVGQDEERGDELRTIEFPRIKGHKKFDVSVGWFQELLGSLGQA